jgi:hypothetical protein
MLLTMPLSTLPAIDWHRTETDLGAHGYATLRLVDAPTCRELAALYDDEARFRSRVVMQKYNFGRGEYKYLSYPLPEPVASLRTMLYPPLAAIANAWRETLGESGRLPPTLEAFLDECHAAGQTRPTPLLLRYGADDYNCLHQDLYGPLVFPLQQGEAVIFPVHHRPAQGTRGAYRVTMRHGVSRVRSGRRHTLGIIFHDAA